MVGRYRSIAKRARAAPLRSVSRCRTPWRMIAWRLPMKVLSQRSGPTRAESPSAHRILIVDDDFGIRGMLTTFLEDEGYQCETARNGQDALMQLQGSDNPPCIILLD